MTFAFNYVEKNPLMTEKEYPYTGKNGTKCLAKEHEEVGHIKSYNQV